MCKQKMTRLTDTLVQWYGSAETAAAVLGGSIGSVDRCLRSIAAAPAWRRRRGMVGFGAPPEIKPEPKQLTELQAALGGRDDRLGQNSTTACTMALRPCGVSVPELMAAIGTDHGGASGRLSALMKRGFLHKAKVQGHHVRYFVREPDAKAWAAAAVPALVKTLQRHAAAGEVPPPRPQGAPLREFARAVLELAGRPIGISTGELASLRAVSYHVASAKLNSMARAGYLIKAPKQPSLKDHFFRTADQVEAWVRAQRAEAAANAFSPVLEPVVKPSNGAGRHAPTKAQSEWSSGGKKAAPKPVQVAAPSAPVEVITPPHVKVQVLSGHPGCDLRYQVRPGDVVDGAGFSAQWRRLRGCADA